MKNVPPSDQNWEKLKSRLFWDLCTTSYPNKNNAKILSYCYIGTISIIYQPYMYKILPTSHQYMTHLSALSRPYYRQTQKWRHLKNEDNLKNKNNLEVDLNIDMIYDMIYVMVCYMIRDLIYNMIYDMIYNVIQWYMI